MIKVFFYFLMKKLNNLNINKDFFQVGTEAVNNLKNA